MDWSDRRQWLFDQEEIFALQHPDYRQVLVDSGLLADMYRGERGEGPYIGVYFQVYYAVNPVETAYRLSTERLRRQSWSWWKRLWHRLVNS